MGGKGKEEKAAQRMHWSWKGVVFVVTGSPASGNTDTRKCWRLGAVLSWQEMKGKCVENERIFGKRKNLKKSGCH